MDREGLTVVKANVCHLHFLSHMSSLCSLFSAAARVDRRDACLRRIDPPLCDCSVDSPLQGEGPEPVLP